MPICKLSFEPIKLTSISGLLFDDVYLREKEYLELCPRYRRWKIDGIRCLAIFDYDETIRNLIYQFKGAGDIELRGIFLSYALPLLRVRYFGKTMVCVPSGFTHDEKRGFNQVKEAFMFLKLKTVDALVKLNETKQSNLPKEEREKIIDYIKVINPSLIRGKSILLVDDIYTTGSTAKACIKKLLEAGARKVEFLCLAKVKEKS